MPVAYRIFSNICCRTLPYINHRLIYTHLNSMKIRTSHPHLTRRKFVKDVALTGMGAAIFPNLLYSLDTQVNDYADSEALTGDGGALKLWYEQPADRWMKATPIGNGRLGAMIFGGITNERIALNEITMWAGKPDPHQHVPCGKKKLAEIRQLFFDGNVEEGNIQARRYLSGKPNTFGTHIPVGDIALMFHDDATKATEYRREVNIENAVTTVQYKIDQVQYTREYFCSNPDDIMVVHISADTEKRVDVAIRLNLLSKSAITALNNQLTYSGQATSTLKVNAFPDFASGGVDFSGIVHAGISGGTITTDGEQLQIKQADKVTLYIDIRTSFVSGQHKQACRHSIKKAVALSYKEIKNRHVNDYRRLYSRVDFSLETTGVADLPTDKRLARYNSGYPDAALCALFMQYSRYLLISCSRENSPLPANLQGVWNDNLAANMPWTCDYHLDINTQQNYWLANVGNLPECNAPLTSFISYLAKAGEQTAREVYGSPGWVAHTVVNVWGYTAPGEWPGWGLFPTAGTWIALHLWEHYNYTKDPVFLKKAYPLLKKNAEFFIDYMVRDPVSGYLMTGPCTSPENEFRYKGKNFSLSMMPTCDRVFIFELFTACVKASQLLGTDGPFAKVLSDAILQLPPIKIAKTGEIQEWFEDYEKALPNHRHTTHLTALYPYAQISLVRTPALASASAKTIQYRLEAPGWEDVEWSRGNMINFFARLKEPEKAHDSINKLLKNLTRDNLFTISVGGIAGANEDIFAFDGNQAGAAGIVEMLLQSHEDFIAFLPALPDEWSTGQYKGLCVRGGATAGVQWKDKQIQKIVLDASQANTFHLKIGLVENMQWLKNGKPYIPIAIKADIATIELKKNDRLEIVYPSL